MAFIVIWKVWHWSLLAAAALMLPFLLIDLTFLGANLLKVVEGGWVPLALGGAGDGRDVHLAARQPAPVREDAAAARCRSTTLVRDAGEEAAAPRAGHGGVPHQRSRTARRPRCCTASSTTRCCTSTTSS